MYWYEKSGDDEEESRVDDKNVFLLLFFFFFHFPNYSENCDIIFQFTRILLFAMFLPLHTITPLIIASIIIQCKHWSICKRAFGTYSLGTVGPVCGCVCVCARIWPSLVATNMVIRHFVAWCFRNQRPNDPHHCRQLLYIHEWTKIVRLLLMLCCHSIDYISAPIWINSEHNIHSHTHTTTAIAH